MVSTGSKTTPSRSGLPSTNWTPPESANLAAGRVISRPDNKAALTKDSREATLSTCDGQMRGVRNRARLVFAWPSGVTPDPPRSHLDPLLDRFAQSPCRRRRAVLLQTAVLLTDGVGRSRTPRFSHPSCRGVRHGRRVFQSRPI